jgi:hypothetical protein
MDMGLLHSYGDFTPNGWKMYEQGDFKSKMYKKLNKNIKEGIGKIAKSKNEYSFAIDFERGQKTPERMLVVKGGTRSTFKLSDFELYGHSHPTHDYVGTNPEPNPSYRDLYNLSKKGSEFLIRSGRGKDAKENMILMKIVNKRKYNKIIKDENADVFHRMWKLKSSSRDRKKFLEETGIEIRPYKENMMIEMPYDKPTVKEKLDVGFQYHIKNRDIYLTLLKNKSPKKRKKTSKKKTSKKKTSKKKATKKKKPAKKRKK